MIDFIVGYFIIYISICLHEVLHVICAKLFKIPLVKIQIGIDWLQISIGKLVISPIVGTSFVEVETEKLQEAPRKIKILFFLSGALGNTVLTILFGILFFCIDKTIFAIAAAINIIIIISSLIPFGNTDMGTLRNLLEAE